MHCKRLVNLQTFLVDPKIFRFNKNSFVIWFFQGYFKTIPPYKYCESYWFHGQIECRSKTKFVLPTCLIANLNLKLLSDLIEGWYLNSTNKKTWMEFLFFLLLLQNKWLFSLHLDDVYSNWTFIPLKLLQVLMTTLIRRWEALASSQIIQWRISEGLLLTKKNWSNERSYLNKYVN